MIRGTKNEGISSLSKQRHAGAFLNYTGTKGQSYELVYDPAGDPDADGDILERRDEFDTHSSLETEFPSNAFNGTFE